MNLQVKKVPSAIEGTTKFVIDGRLDATTSSDFEKTITPMLTGPIEIVILDLSHVPFISSAGIRALMHVNKTMTERNAKVICTNMQPQIAKVMEIIRMLPGVQVFANDQEMDNYLAHIQRQEILKQKGEE